MTRGLTSGRGLVTPPHWTAIQVAGFVTAGVLAAVAVRKWKQVGAVWDERLHRRLLVAASSGFVTMLALAGTLLIAAPVVALTDLSVSYLQIGIGILSAGVILWEIE